MNNHDLSRILAPWVRVSLQPADIGAQLRGGDDAAVLRARARQRRRSRGAAAGVPARAPAAARHGRLLAQLPGERRALRSRCTRRVGFWRTRLDRRPPELLLQLIEALRARSRPRRAAGAGGSLLGPRAAEGALGDPPAAVRETGSIGSRVRRAVHRAAQRPQHDGAARRGRVAAQPARRPGGHRAQRRAASPRQLRRPAGARARGAHRTRSLAPAHDRHRRAAHARGARRGGAAGAREAGHDPPRRAARGAPLRRGDRRQLLARLRDLHVQAAVAAVERGCTTASSSGTPRPCSRWPTATSWSTCPAIAATWTTCCCPTRSTSMASPCRTSPPASTSTCRWSAASCARAARSSSAAASAATRSTPSCSCSTSARSWRAGTRSSTSSRAGAAAPGGCWRRRPACCR